MKLKLEENIWKSMLGRRLIFSFFLTGLIPLFIFVFFMNLYIRSVLISRTHRELVKYCNLAGQRLFETLSNARRNLSLMSGNGAAGKFLDIKTPLQLDEAGMFVNMAVLDLDWKVIKRTSESFEIPSLTPEKQKAIKEGKTVASEPYIPKGLEWPRLCLFTPVFLNKSPVAVLAGELKKEVLWDVTRNLYYLENANIFIMSRSGGILATSAERTKALMPLFSPLQFRKSFPKTSGTSIITHPEFGKVLAGYYTVFLAGAFTMDNILIVIFKDYSNALDVLQIIRYWFFLILSLSLCLLIMIAFRNIRNILTPIDSLTVAVKKISHGDAQHRAPVQTQDEIGQLAQFFNNMTDALMLSKKEISESNEYKESIIKGLTDTLFVTDSRAGIKTVNPSLLALLGYREDELLGKHASVLFGIEEDVFQKFYYETGPVTHHDTFYHHKDGTAIPVSLSTAVMKNGDGRYMGLIAMARDMRESKLLQEIDRAYRELKDMQEKLIRSEKLSLLGQLSAGIAHEMRNPLGIVRAAAYNLKKSKRTPSPQDAENLEIIENEIMRMNKVISSILEFSRAPSRAKESIHVTPVLDECLASVQTEVSFHRLRIVKDYQDNPLLKIDPHRLRLALYNIVLNAAHALENKGGDIRLSVFCEESRLIKIHIADTGHGIPEEYLSKIFDPFFTTKQNSRGIGIGLALTRIIIEAEGGNISVESKIGEGTRFTLAFPADEKAP